MKDLKKRDSKAESKLENPELKSNEALIKDINEVEQKVKK